MELGPIVHPLPISGLTPDVSIWEDSCVLAQGDFDVDVHAGCIRHGYTTEHPVLADSLTHDGFGIRKLDAVVYADCLVWVISDDRLHAETLLCCPLYEISEQQFAIGRRRELLEALPEPGCAEAIEAGVDLADRKRVGIGVCLLNDRLDAAFSVTEYAPHPRRVGAVGSEERGCGVECAVAVHHFGERSRANEGGIAVEHEYVVWSPRGAVSLQQGVACSEWFGLGCEPYGVSERIAKRLAARRDDNGDVIDAGGSDCVNDQQEHFATADAVECLGRTGFHARAQACGKDYGGVVLWTLPFSNQLAASLSKG